MSASEDSRPDIDADVSHAWRASSREEPPAALDDAIRAAARREVSARPRRGSVPAWIPLAVAATVGAVAIGIVQLTPPERVTPGASVNDAEVRPAPASAKQPATPAIPQQPAITTATPRPVTPSGPQSEATRRVDEAAGKGELALAERSGGPEQRQAGGQPFPSGELSPRPGIGGAPAAAPEASRRGASAERPEAAFKPDARKATRGTPPDSDAERAASTGRDRTAETGPRGEASHGSGGAVPEPAPAPDSRSPALARDSRSPASAPDPRASASAQNSQPLASEQESARPPPATVGRLAQAFPSAPTSTTPPTSTNAPLARNSLENSSTRDRDDTGRPDPSANTSKREPSAAMAQAPAAARSAFPERGRAQRSVAEWIAYIRRLRGEGRTDEAAKELAAFHDVHGAGAEALLPSDLKQPQAGR